MPGIKFLLCSVKETRHLPIILFKDYIADTLKNRESSEHPIIKNQLSSGNTVCGGSDAITKPSQCDGVVSFTKLACVATIHLYHQTVLIGI
jgi:hypothetical protein